MNLLDKLHAMRTYGGARQTVGLADDVVQRFSNQHANLQLAIDEAYDLFLRLKIEMPEFLSLDETAQIQKIQAQLINFYQDDSVNPYATLTARGPWIITLKGAVIHDSGGYGMLGLGHAPTAILDAMAKPHVMANVMTANISQLKLAHALTQEIGQNRKNACPYTKFLCLNSGSEAVSLAGRIADVNSKLMTDPGAAHSGWKIKKLAVKGAFHGRTELPAFYSDSSRKTYSQYLASYRNSEEQLIIVEPYNIDQLKQAFEDAESQHIHIEAMFLEPVMGEGNPGRAVSVEFYKTARELTRAHGTLLLVDSIQAGLRAHGYLSIVDYPGFEKLEAPDMETYSKALNAGQYPLSVLAVNERAAQLYRKGVYGNTMTTNPRAMDVACAVLKQLTPALRQNIQERGKEFVDKLSQLAHELPGLITKVQGTGLLVSCELNASFKCYGAHSTEEFLRLHGFGVIHGGVNSLRFTPPFTITSEEIDLIIQGIKTALLEGPKLKAPAQRMNNNQITV